MFENFESLKDTNSLLFLQLCIYYYTNIMSAVMNKVQMEDSQILLKPLFKTRMVKLY